MVNRKRFPSHPYGKEIIDCLNRILKLCKEAGVRLDYPGEGDERPFRNWLVTDLIIKLLGWPAEKVVAGERFDILLSFNLSPSLTITIPSIQETTAV